MTKEEKKEYNKEYNKLNKEKISNQKKKYYSNSDVKENKLKYSKKRYLENKEKIIDNVMKYHWENQDEIRVYKKKYRKENSDKIKNRVLQKSFGITLDEYNLMFENQNGCCAICNKPETARNKVSGAILMLAVDHCHITGKVRGLLCGTHNPALGAFGDSIEQLQSAIDYLKKYENR